MTLTSVLLVARNAAHDLTAVVGILAGSTGAVVSVLDSVGVHVSDAGVAHVLLIAGLAVTTASKAIDSLNDAVKGGTTPFVPTQSTTSPRPAASVTVLPAEPKA